MRRTGVPDVDPRRSNCDQGRQAAIASRNSHRRDLDPNAALADTEWADHVGAIIRVCRTTHARQTATGLWKTSSEVAYFVCEFLLPSDPPRLFASSTSAPCRLPSFRPSRSAPVRSRDVSPLNWSAECCQRTRPRLMPVRPSNPDYGHECHNRQLAAISVL